MVTNKTTSNHQSEDFLLLNESQIPSREPQERIEGQTEEEKAAAEYEDMINQHFLKRKDIKWKNIYIFVTLHLVALYGFIAFPYKEKKVTCIWSCFLIMVANFGVAAGVHRLWSHRAYKAKLPLRIILSVCYLVSGQYSILYWVRDHRIHHKFSETNADPVNSSRGFWFSHIGWMTMKRHPAVLQKGKSIDMSDVLSDPVVEFIEKHFDVLRLVIGFLIPLVIPVYFWDESWYWATISQIFMRYVVSLNITWGLNSFAHMFGNRPYDKDIAPADNVIVSLLSGGDGWHNYHHTFPADYKSAEYGNYIVEIGLTTLLIDVFAKIGWAYDLKQPSKELIRTVTQKRGDGTHPVCKSSKKLETKTE
ncbi:acyl-CoA Delta-9 desaturase-like [Planococcus citri]|uniref:acyl-CoA Delta-9 desaturase-like n=1 Tax=Planococcus citri TaxID=170843 RepID=UPI0031F87448